MGRWTLLVTLTTTLTLTGPQLTPTTAEPRGRQKRWTHDNSHLRDMTQDHIHPWMNNAWYRYIHDRTRTESENTDCYVCSHMPSTSTHPTLYGEYMNKTQAKCAASFAGIGSQHSRIITSDTIPHAVGLSNGTCDQLFWIDFNVTNRNTSIHFPVFLDQLPGKNHSMCYQQEKGNTPVGNTTNCVQTAVHGEGAPVNMSGPSNGMYWVQGMAWLCGQRAYFILPPGWTGTCAPIFLSDHTFRMTAVNITSTARRKRRSTFPKLQPHDPIWGSNVPEEFKLWTTGQKKGGLCVLFNNTCCTYIPDNVYSSNMTDAPNALRQIQQAQNQDYVSNTSDWFSWLYTGSWLQVLKRLLLPFHCAILFVNNQRCSRLQYLKYLQFPCICIYSISTFCILLFIYMSLYLYMCIYSILLTFCNFCRCCAIWKPNFTVNRINTVLSYLILLIGAGVFLLVFCVFVTCILPCLKLMINRIIVSTVATYIAMTNDDDDDDPDLLECEDFV
ncbi:FH1/FH2 domain-containing protein 1 [Sarotherodon galilaeus]